MLNAREMGEIIRKVRKEKGLRLQELADNNISPATISNIERGRSGVKFDKIEYLFEKLDIHMDKLTELLHKDKSETQEIENKLFVIETKRDIGMEEEALEELKGINLPHDHQYAATVSYLMGKCYVSLGKLSRAERHLYEAIRLSKNHPYGTRSNIEADAFNYLAICSYRQDEIERALTYTNSGIDAFNPEGERGELIHILQVNRVNYLKINCAKCLK